MTNVENAPERPPILTRMADLAAEMRAIRRDIHQHPELAYQETRTAALVAKNLRSWGIEVHEGIGKTGVVGVLSAGDSTRTIGLRADMDALPIVEASGLAHQSLFSGVSHCCGHDGHTSMLLGAARYLAETRRFNGRVHFIFQPAEEGRAGAAAMMADGLFERFPCQEVYALHNWPSLPAGTVATRPGPIMAAGDKFEITVRAAGGHAAQPQLTPDAILCAAGIISGAHTLVSRRIDPNDSAVLSITKVNGGNSHNVLPSTVVLTGTVRTFDGAVQDTIEHALRELVAGTARAARCDAEVQYTRYYPATVNDAGCAAHALAAGRALFGDALSLPAPAFTSEFLAMYRRKAVRCRIALGVQTTSSGRLCLLLRTPGSKPRGNAIMADSLAGIEFGDSFLYLPELPFLGLDVSRYCFRRQE